MNGQEVAWIFWHGAVPLLGGIMAFVLAGVVHRVVHPQKTWPGVEHAVDPIAWLFVGLTTAAGALNEAWTGMATHLDQFGGPFAEGIVLIVTTAIFHVQASGARAEAVLGKASYEAPRRLKYFAFFLAVAAIAVAYQTHAIVAAK